MSFKLYKIFNINIYILPSLAFENSVQLICLRAEGVPQYIVLGPNLAIDINGYP